MVVKVEIQPTTKVAMHEKVVKKNLCDMK